MLTHQTGAIVTVFRGHSHVMNRTIANLVASVPLILLMGMPATATERPIVASIHPLALLLDELVGDQAEVEVLIDTSQSSHHFSLRPSDMRILRSAQVVFWLGPDLEAPLLSAFDAYPNIPHTALLTGGVADPHVWLDPSKAQTLMRTMSAILTADGLRDQFIDIDQASSRLQQLDTELTEALEPYRQVPFVTLHNAWSHFAHHYGLNMVGALPGDGEHDVGVRAVSELRATIKETAARCMIIEPVGEQRLATTVSRDLDIQVVELDPIGAEIPRGKGAYAVMMRNIVARLTACLARP